jgi:hypothetical protein
MGGWAVDAVLGYQTRPHKDLDIILRVSNLPKLRKVLEGECFEVQDGGTESNFVMSDRRVRRWMFTPFTFDQEGNGVYRIGKRVRLDLPGSGFWWERYRQWHLGPLSVRRRLRCSAMLTATRQQKRTFEIWNCLRPGSELSYRNTCVASGSDGRLRQNGRVRCLQTHSV